MKKNAFLIIDPQNDFTSPEGSLYVRGADRDMNKLSFFINENKENIHGIAVSLDTHDILDINNPIFWMDSEGETVKEFTKITKKEAKGRKYTVAAMQNEFGVFERVDTKSKDYDFDGHMRFHKGATKYLEELEKMGKSHIIWPYHCLTGSWGHSINESLMNSIKGWATETTNNYRVLYKGQFPFSEHQGIFEAVIPVGQASDTTKDSVMVRSLLDYLIGNAQVGYDNGMDRIYLCGESKNHSIAETIKQIIKFSKEDKDFEQLKNKLIIVEDCMSTVKGFEKDSEKMIALAKENGIEVTTLDKINLEEE